MLEFSPNPADVATYQKEIILLAVVTFGILGLLARRYFGHSGKSNPREIDPRANYDPAAVAEGIELQKFVEREMAHGATRLAETWVSGPPDVGQQYVYGDMSLAAAAKARLREKNKRNKKRRKSRGIGS